MISPHEALERLRQGNRRFTRGTPSRDGNRCHARRTELTTAQEPGAIILGCSDSRVPAEIVFDQGIGDLFVIRVAGNIAGPSQIGSVEFAATQFATRLVVVLGHSRCGAVIATVNDLEQPLEGTSPNLRSIIDRVRPSVEGLLRTELRHDLDTLIAHAARANVNATANRLRYGSQVLEELVQGGDLLIVGAEYSLDTGEVEFFDCADAIAAPGAAAKEVPGSCSRR